MPFRPWVTQVHTNDFWGNYCILLILLIIKKKWLISNSTILCHKVLAFAEVGNCRSCIWYCSVVSHTCGIDRLQLIVVWNIHPPSLRTGGGPFGMNLVRLGVFNPFRRVSKCNFCKPPLFRLNIFAFYFVQFSMDLRLHSLGKYDTFHCGQNRSQTARSFVFNIHHSLFSPPGLSFGFLSSFDTFSSSFKIMHYGRLQARLNSLSLCDLTSLLLSMIESPNKAAIRP